MSGGSTGKGVRVSISLLEKAILFSLVTMCLISAADALRGHDVGNRDQLRMARLQAQQELMALRAVQKMP